MTQRTSAAIPPKQLIGRTLVDLLASARPAEGEGLPGIQRPLYFSVVLLLDGGERVSFQNADLTAWQGSEKLEPVTARTFQIDPLIEFRGQLIVKVCTDEDGDLLLVLANQTTLQVVTEHGTRISLDSPWPA